MFILSTLTRPSTATFEYMATHAITTGEGWYIYPNIYEHLTSFWTILQQSYTTDSVHPNTGIIQAPKTAKEPHLYNTAQGLKVSSPWTVEDDLQSDRQRAKGRSDIGGRDPGEA